MTSVYIVYVLLISIALAVTVLFLIRNDERPAQRFARVRVRVDRSPHHRQAEPSDEEFETSRAPELMIIGFLLLLLFMVFGRA